MVTVDTSKMAETSNNMPSTIYILNENIQKLVEATKNANYLNVAKVYDVQNSTLPNKEVISHTSGLKFIYGLKAILKIHKVKRPLQE